MRLGGRLAAAIEVLDDIERRRRPAADALKDWGLSHRFAGAGDRGAIGNIVYGALRRKRSAHWLFDAETPRAAAIGALLLEWNLTARALNATLEGDRFAPAPLHVGEIASIEAQDAALAPDVVRADCPDWCEPLLRASFGDGWVEEGRALSGRPPLDLRANTLLSDRHAVMAELTGMQASASRLAPDGIRIPPIDGAGRHPNVQAEPAFQKGWFEVQDEGSQLVALLAGAEAGMQVLDFCAGAGGKTLAMAASMRNSGQIFAFDSEKARLAPIFDRIRRGGCRNVQVVAKPGELTALEGRMDLVLVDAPCTGSGTWRRRPDAKWRLSARQLEVRRAEQSKILDHASRFVKPGGRLAYVTCSVFREENQDQVDVFLARDGGFTAEAPGNVWRHAQLPFPAPVSGDGIVLTPHNTGTDGFFFAALRRTV
ncbi:MAG: RsmB/NOP family class I SAM-dependent RNA methyltransferase [Rhizobiaceae bacterium]